MDMNKDALFRGEFELKDDGAKNECDKVIDTNGPAETVGTWIKLSYEIKDDAAQVFLESKIMNNIQQIILHDRLYCLHETGCRPCKELCI